MVLQFHEAFRLPVANAPTLDVPSELLALRWRLLCEEIHELSSAFDRDDLIGVADALGDIVYVLFGTALTVGIDLDAVVSEVHRANMSKLDRNGDPLLRADGKVLKGPDYRPPDIEAALGSQSSPKTARSSPAAFASHGHPPLDAGA
jgi:predicted HAD superfamily Cof-like phosphohydrolase